MSDRSHYQRRNSRNAYDRDRKRIRSSRRSRDPFPRPDRTYLSSRDSRPAVGDIYRMKDSYSSYRANRSRESGRDRSRDHRRNRSRDVAKYSLHHTRSSSTHSSDIDDSIGHFHGHPGTEISNRYVIEKELGTGTFGKVYYCLDRKYGDHIALKVVRSIKRYIDSARIEASILRRVYDSMKKYQSDSCMKMYSHFSFRDHYCLVCEPLGKSLYEYIKENDYVGFPLDYVREISRQLLQSLAFLESMSLIHTDLKLENVLFASPDSSYKTITSRGKERTINLPTSTKIKLIDFGGATFDNESKSTIINTRQYRGPEVTLELGWSYPSDVWCVGCIIAEAYCGDLLFPTHDDLEHLAMIERSLGVFPTEMAKSSHVGRDYFHRDGRVRVEELSSDSKKALRDLVCLEDLFVVSPGDERSGLKELLQGLLKIDPSHRLNASNALKSSFFNE